MKTNELIYEGKAKKIFATDDGNVLIMEFKDSLTAFNALKKGEFAGKGALNCRISTLLFKLLSKNGIAHHWLASEEDKYMRVQKTTIIPLEVVVRNFVAGSLAKKLGQSEGAALSQPVVEFYFKNDALGDPFVNDDHAIAFGWATAAQISTLKKQAVIINEILLKTFASVGLKLVDFKLEFGINSKQEVILSDEISPDCMRLWDSQTNKKLDKDRFRQDLGAIDEAYTEVFERLNKGVEL